MKATDIQIGDWLQNTNGNIGKVQAIYRYHNPGDKEFGYEIVMQYNPNGTCYTDLSLLKPIPLTAEILEKNGFSYCTRDGGYYLFATMSCGFDVEVILFDVVNKYASIQLHIGDTNDTATYLHLMQCDCVHELQHALRLCGIEKEIVI